jgi:hypothetical protein
LRVERAEFLAALGTREAQEAMQAYLDAVRDVGELPAYDDSTLRQALATGRFDTSARSVPNDPPSDS